MSDEGKTTDERNKLLFFDERKSLVKQEQKESSSFVKYLLTFATGTFALTLTFIKDVTNDHLISGTKWMIVEAWYLLSVTVALTLISFLAGIAAYRKQIRIDREYFLYNEDDKPPERNIWTYLIVALNLVSTATFIVGLVFLFLFVVNNLPFGR